MAKARVYENKTIVGGTIVGCTSRLESIRATRPFAVVNAEASEVLEPLLLSCLSDSTMKLEMVGDHRQLQPSVSSRFDFEHWNKIAVSMFQRLIEAPTGHLDPSTVLSVQRRMRQNICDLSRSFYEDIIAIEDHDDCRMKVVGQHLSVNERSIVQYTTTSGREKPGVAPHVFLWMHDGEQK
jgi:AAA domain